MKVLNVQPKDIYITFEISLKDADRLLAGLGNSELKFNPTKPDEVAAKETIEKFFEMLDEVVEGLKKDGIRSDSAS